MVKASVVTKNFDDSERRSFCYTTLLVVACHAALFFYLTFDSDTALLVHPKNRITVQTVKLNNVSQSQSVSSGATTPNKTSSVSSTVVEKNIATQKEKATAEKKDTAIAQKPKTTVAIEKTKVSLPKKQTPAAQAKISNTKPTDLTKKPEAKTTENAALSEAAKKKEALIAAAKASVGKINNVSQKTTSLSQIKDASFEPLPLVSQEKSGDLPAFGSRQITYAEEIANLLKTFLHLPQYGEVDITLTLTRHGKFLDLVIVKSQNKTNSKYVEANVRTIEFPPFGKNFPGETKRTFSIKLSMDTL